MNDRDMKSMMMAAERRSTEIMRDFLESWRGLPNRVVPEQEMMQAAQMMQEMGSQPEVQNGENIYRQNG